MAVHLFENKGWENTYKTAELEREYAKEHGLKYVVLASKTGYTIDIFMETFAKAGVDVKKVCNTLLALSYDNLVAGVGNRALELSDNIIL